MKNKTYLKYSLFYFTIADPDKIWGRDYSKRYHIGSMLDMRKTYNSRYSVCGAFFNAHFSATTASFAWDSFEKFLEQDGTARDNFLALSGFNTKQGICKLCLKAVSDFNSKFHQRLARETRIELERININLSSLVDSLLEFNKVINAPELKDSVKKIKILVGEANG